MHTKPKNVTKSPISIELGNQFVVQKNPLLYSHYLVNEYWNIAAKSTDLKISLSELKEQQICWKNLIKF